MKKAEIPVIDLHCDLLSFLSDKAGRSPEDPASRSSYPQLSEGHVKLQTLAIYGETGKDSLKSGKAQVEWFQRLLTQYPTQFSPCKLPLKTQSPQVHILPAFENASTFAGESEPLSTVFKRLSEYIQAIGPVFYISLTWSHENRFGGGDQTNVGLKDDGKRLLEWMHGKKIAIDLSHTSDQLAHGILNFLEQYSLDIPVMASHSNFRAISDYPRNLPNDIAQEIIRRQGLIGLNFFAPFIHKTDPSALLRHVEYGLSLGGQNALCFGADFFCASDFSNILTKYQRKEAFYPGLNNSSVYPSVLAQFAEELSLKEELLLKIACQNALAFITQKIL